MSQYSGTVIPVHPDPRFVISLKLIECEQPVADKKKDEILAVAIHSPTVLLRTRNPQGHEFLFTVDRLVEGELTRYRNLTAQKKEANQALEPTATAVTDRATHAPRQP